MSRAVAVVAGVLVCLVAGCVHSGTLPKPPTDQDLVSDGTPAARQRLMDRYSVRIENKAPDVLRLIRVGDAKRQYATYFLGTTDDDVRAYLVSDPDAGRHLHGFKRETLANLLTEGPRLLLLPLGLLLPAGAITLLVLGERGVDPLGNVPVAILVGMSVASLAGLALWAAAGITGFVLHLFDNAARDDAINTFNANLSDRIGRNVLTVVKAPTAPEPPAPETVPPPRVLPDVTVVDSSQCVTRDPLNAELGALLQPGTDLKGAQVLVEVRPTPEGGRSVRLLVMRGTPGEVPLERQLQIGAAECQDTARVLARIAVAYLEDSGAAQP